MFLLGTSLFLVLMKDNIPGTRRLLQAVSFKKKVLVTVFSYSTLLTGHRSAWYGELDMLICPWITGTLINTSFAVQEKASAQFILFFKDGFIVTDFCYIINVMTIKLWDNWQLLFGNNI